MKPQPLAKLTAVWQQTTTDRTRIAAYIESRGLPASVLDDVADDALRFYASLEYWDYNDSGDPVLVGLFPAMVARVTDIDGHGVSLHRTYLSADGPGKAPVDDPRKLMSATTDGATKGASIKLTPAGSVLCIGEGIETTLAVHVATGLPGWSAVSAGGMESIIVPDDVRTVHVWADNDRSGRGQQAAEKAAERLCSEGRTVFVHLSPRVGIDWLDEYISAGPDALMCELTDGVPWVPEVTASSMSTPDEWEPPLPLDSPGHLPVFPVEVLPECLRDFAQEVSESVQVPVDMPAVAELGIVAAAAAGRFITHLPTHEEPLNLYLLSAVEPGTRKTQVLRDMTAPVYEIERELIDQAKPGIDNARVQHDLDEERLRHLRGKGAKLDDQADRRAVQAEMAELLQSMSAPPSSPRLLADDVTPERLAALLAENKGVMAIVSAEGGIVGMMAGRYNDKGGPNLDVYLKAHSGDPLRIDRASDSGHPRIIDHPALTMVLMVQPEVLAQLAKVPSARGRGLLGRFLYSLPECGLGSRAYRSRPIDPTVERCYHDRIRQMLAHHMPEVPRPLRFSDEALSVWIDFANDVEQRQAEGRDLRQISDWASKAAGAVARIAGGLHVVENAGGRPEDIPISATTAQAAVAIGYYFIDHALAAFALMSDSPDMKLGRRIAGWIERHEVTEFSLRDCHQHIRTEQPSDLEPGLRILESRDIIRRLPMSPKSGPGQRPSPRYAVNPHLRNHAQNSQIAPGASCQSYSVNSVNLPQESETEPEVLDPYRTECLI